jgi:ribosome maturation factor RimP
VTIAVEVAGKPGAKKRPPTPRQIPWGELGAGRVQVEFGRADAVPDDAEDSDDIEIDDTQIDDTDNDLSAEPQVSRGGGQ